MKHFAFALATRRRTSHVALLIVCSAVALIAASSGRAVAHIDGLQAHQLPNFDARESVAPSRAQLAAAQRARREGQLEPVRSSGLGDQVRRLPRDRARGVRRRVGRARLDRRQQGALQAELDGRARRGDGAAARRHDRRLRSRLPAAGERRRVDRRLRHGQRRRLRRGGLEDRVRVFEPDRRDGRDRLLQPGTGGGVDRSRQPRRGQRLDPRRLRSGNAERHDDARRQRLLGAAEGEARPSSRRRIAVPARRTRPPSSRRERTAFSRATTSSSTRRRASCSTARTPSTTSPTTRPGSTSRSRRRARR